MRRELWWGKELNAANRLYFAITYSTQGSRKQPIFWSVLVYVYGGAGGAQLLRRSWMRQHEKGGGDCGKEIE